MTSSSRSSSLSLLAGAFSKRVAPSEPLPNTLPKAPQRVRRSRRRREKTRSSSAFKHLNTGPPQLRAPRFSVALRWICRVLGPPQHTPKLSTPQKKGPTNPRKRQTRPPRPPLVATRPRRPAPPPRRPRFPSAEISKQVANACAELGDRPVRPPCRSSPFGLCRVWNVDSEFLLSFLQFGIAAPLHNNVGGEIMEFI